MTTTQKNSSLQNGLLFGGITGLVYCISLFIRYNQASMNPIYVAVITFAFYLLIMVGLYLCGTKRKADLGGFISLREAFQTIFVAVLIAELIYLVFNIIYLKYIDPGYFDKFYASMENFLEKTIKDDSQREQALDKLKEQLASQKDKGMTLRGILSSYLIGVSITGIFGFLMALIVRKEEPVFEVSNK